MLDNAHIRKIYVCSASTSYHIETVFVTVVKWLAPEKECHFYLNFNRCCSVVLLLRGSSNNSLVEKK